MWFYVDRRKATFGRDALLTRVDLVDSEVPRRECPARIYAGLEHSRKHLDPQWTHAKRVGNEIKVMTLFMPKKVVLNWYRYDVSFSAELIESFVDGIERQAAESFDNYERGKRIEVVEHYARSVHQGLDDETWDLPTIFREYFPNLQRRSALLTVYSYFEYELDKLCRLYQSEKNFGLTLDDLRDKGIDRSTGYLQKVAGLNVHYTSQEWREIRNIQKIRNDIVHRGGKLRDDQTVVDWMNKLKTLSRDNEGEIVLGKGFLSYVTHTYTSYFKLIGDSINAVSRTP